jgi:hypothetical protein
VQAENGVWNFEISYSRKGFIHVSDVFFFDPIIYHDIRSSSTMVTTRRAFISAVGILATLLPVPCQGFQSSHSIVELRRPTPIGSFRDNCDLESVDESPSLSQICRRQVLTSLAIAGTTFNVNPAIAKESYSIDCLSDLPPLAADSVRIYLCRHGETENNRLGLVQGARIDPPINTRGRAQAQRMGEALSRAVTKPSIFLHSPLLRATQTTELAAAAMSRAPKVAAESSLAEVDFGQVAEGRPVAEVRGGMVQTYASWAVGDIDQRMAGGGENGREVRG